ncbi:hypothetical protein CJF41_14405 [Pseudomonas lundensis]|uniref:Uncharacterized protein n=1 Tax=Pseudomonas lundensis TaxID=86185 RepID=A0AAX2HDI2_9PSED|nr:hypothetical protein CJF41_14405 [Pseudomonas lundensis]SOB54900.1 hypothetical protein PLUA15_560031 [Pseudomonas lundensis]
MAAVRRLVDRRNQEPGALEGALRTATIKREAEKKRLAEVAPCAWFHIGRLNPTAECAAVGRD